MAASSSPSSSATRDQICAAVVASLSDDVLKPDRRRAKAKLVAQGVELHPLAWHCYRASEALFRLLGGKAAGYKAMQAPHEGDSHWWIRHLPTGTDIDLTAAQFATPVPYHEAQGKGFLTSEPCREARVIMQRASARLRKPLAA